MSKIIKEVPREAAKRGEGFMIVAPSLVESIRKKQRNTYADWDRANIVVSNPKLNKNTQLANRLSYMYTDKNGNKKEAMLHVESPRDKKALFKSFRGITHKKKFFTQTQKDDRKVKGLPEEEFTDELQCYSVLGDLEHEHTKMFMDIVKDIYIANAEAYVDNEQTADGKPKDFKLPDDWIEKVTFTEYVSDFQFPLFFVPKEVAVETVNKKGVKSVSIQPVPDDSKPPLIGAGVTSTGKYATTFVDDEGIKINPSKLKQISFAHVPLFTFSGSGWYGKGVKIRISIKSTIVDEIFEADALTQLETLEERKLMGIQTAKGVDDSLNSAIMEAEKDLDNANGGGGGAGGDGDDQD